MIKTTSRVVVAAATASMAFAPIAVQANTRASDSAPVYSTANAQPGVARAATGEDVRGKSGGWILALLSAAAIIAGIVVLAGNDDDDISPGT